MTSKTFPQVHLLYMALAVFAIALSATVFMSTLKPHVSRVEFEASVLRSGGKMEINVDSQLELSIFLDTKVEDIELPNRRDLAIRLRHRALNSDLMKLLTLCDRGKLILDVCDVTSDTFTKLASVTCPEIVFRSCRGETVRNTSFINARTVTIDHCDSNSSQDILEACRKRAINVHIEGMNGAGSLAIPQMKRLSFCTIEDVSLSRGSLDNLGDELNHLRLDNVNLMSEDLVKGLSKQRLQILSMQNVQLSPRDSDSAASLPSLQSVTFEGDNSTYEKLKTIVLCKITRRNPAVQPP